MKSRPGISTIAIALAAMVGLCACFPKTPEERADWVASQISSKLDLTADQKAKLDGVKQAYLENRKAHEADRAKHLEALDKLILSDHLDRTQTKNLTKQRQKLEDDSFDSIFPKVADFHASLTQAQKQKAVDLIEKLSNQFGR